MRSPLSYFSELRDPRVERTREHLLEEILLMVLAAVLSGAGSWNEIEGYCKAKRDWLKSFLSLPGGIPSHDTFNRVVSALDPAELEKSFAAWAGSIAKLTAGEVVAIDGKALCGTREAGAGPSLLEKATEWASLQGLVRIQAERYHKATGKTEREIRYYITSLQPDAERLNQAIRQHWAIENKLHWALDVSFGEDLDRKRAGNAAQNFSLFNRIALNLLQQEKSTKLGIKGKRLKAGWDNDYLLHLLGN